MKSSQVFLIGMLSFIFGVVMASIVKIPAMIVWEFFVLAGIYAVAFWRKKVVWMVVLALLSFGLGALRMNWALQEKEKVLAGQGIAQTEKAQGISEAITQKLGKVINAHFSPPYSGLLSGILLGDEQGLSWEWKQKMNAAGIRHITSVSGSHIVIFMQMLTTLAIWFGLWRQQALVVALIFSLFFIFLVGAPSPAVRAGVMGSTLILCQILGRQNAQKRAVILAGVVLLVFNPLLLKNDIGFQLSFSACLGIAYFYQFFDSWALRFWAWLKNFVQGVVRKYHKDFPLGFENDSDQISKPGKLITWLVSILAISLSAQIFNLPLGMYYFGSGSLVAPIANILVGLLTPMIMASGFLFLIFGFVASGLGWAFSFLVWLPIWALVKTADFFSSFWFSQIHFYFGLPMIAFVYLFLGFLAWKVDQASKEFL